MTYLSNDIPAILRPDMVGRLARLDQQIVETRNRQLVARHVNRDSVADRAATQLLDRLLEVRHSITARMKP